jgi:hypothetical protein
MPKAIQKNDIRSALLKKKRERKKKIYMKEKRLYDT